MVPPWRFFLPPLVYSRRSPHSVMLEVERSRNREEVRVPRADEKEQVSFAAKAR